MPTRTKHISKNTIETEIYKTFDLFKKQSKVTTAEYLKYLDVSIFQTKKYRKIRYDYQSLIKLVLYKEIKGFKFNTKLAKHLRRNPKDKYRLGFQRTPDRTQIGYFTNHILSKETKELLIFTADKIIEISEKFGILFDIKTLQPIKPVKKTKPRNQQRIRREQTRKASKILKKRISPFIDFHRHHNTKYSKKQLIDLLIHLGLNQDFAENGSKVFRELRRQHGPDADTLLYHLKKYDDLKEVQRMFIQLFEVIWTIARQANMFDTRKKLDVAIDFTEWFYYGKNGKMVTSKEPERGTDKCYKFATINIVESGRRFTLLSLPVNVLTDKKRMLSTLLLFARKKIRIRYAYLDRGFYDEKSIRTLRSLHVKYLMPAMRHTNVRKLMRMLPAPSIISDFKIKNTPTTLVLVKLRDRGTKKLVKRVFATNIEFSENDVNLAVRIGKLYKKRWGIETSYRVKKHSFRGKTTSKNYMIRLFYFLFSVLLYNMWIIADILIWMHIHGFIGEDHLVTSKLFGNILKEIDPGG